MKILFKGKDGGVESKVTGYWLFESKRFGSIVVLRFDEGSREAFHTHAFHAVSWVLRGELLENVLKPIHGLTFFTPSFRPIFTAKEQFHRVTGIAKTSWVLSFRGPWVKFWKEKLPDRGEITLTHGRKEVQAND